MLSVHKEKKDHEGIFQDTRLKSKTYPEEKNQNIQVTWTHPIVSHYSLFIPVGFSTSYKSHQPADFYGFSPPSPSQSEAEIRARIYCQASKLDTLSWKIIFSSHSMMDSLRALSFPDPKGHIPVAVLEMENQYLDSLTNMIALQGQVGMCQGRRRISATVILHPFSLPYNHQEEGCQVI